MGNTSGRHRLNSIERYWQEKHGGSVQIDISRFLLTDIGRKKRWEAARTDTDQTHQTDTGKKDIGLIREDIKWSLQTDLAKDVGKHFRQTPIELTRKILARRHASSVQIDISRFLITDIGRKRQVRTSSDRHWSNPLDRHWQERCWVDPGRHQVIPSDRLAKDVGKHF